MRQVNLNPFRAASNETARDINRRIILNLIRTGQPISRADLARRSGLQRSTVSLITEELIVDKWVIEGPMGRLPRGRRPTFLHLNDQRAVICVDIRPSRITLGVADVNGGFTSQEVLPHSVRSCRCREGIGAPHPRHREGTAGEVLRRRGRQCTGPRGSFESSFGFRAQFRLAADRSEKPVERATGLEVELENAANACAFPKCGSIPRRFAIWLPSPFRKDRNRHPGPGPAHQRQARHGGRVWPCAARSGRSAVQLREQRLLGNARLEHGRASLLL